MSKGLTVKQAKFVKGVASGMPKYKAAMAAYDTTDMETAASIAKENLQKTSIIEALHMEMEKQGLTLEKIIRPVTNALNHESVELQLKGHDRAIRLMVPKGESGTTVNVNFTNIAKGDASEFGI